MDDGKPTGPKAKWWSRTPQDGAPETPLSGPSAPASTGDPSADDASTGVPATATVPSPAHGTDAPPPHAGPETPARAAAPDPAPAPPSAPPQDAAPPARPLHEPDPYSTPPYGGPGPWAPAPPVQHPVPTPAHGTGVSVPPAYGADVPGSPAHGTAVPPPYTGPGGPGFAPPVPTQPQSHQAGHPPMTGPQLPHPSSPYDPSQPSSQWLQYDPWSTARQPLSRPGVPLGPGAGPKKNRRGALLVGAVLLALVAGGIGGGVGAYVERNGGITTVELPQAGRDSGGRAPDSVAGIAASALPSVVTLHVSGDSESGTGTGFVLDKQGHILTNNHVVAPAGSDGEISVTFSGGETAAAEIVGKDSGYDLAVVKVTGVSGLRPLPLGNSDNVRVGDPVVAIGAPFDLSNTVTSGIISAKDRPITAGGEKGDGSDVSYVDALQTDAPINPGNSGGPLVDTHARVIGINSAIRAAGSGSDSEDGQSGSIGLGFAIPINQGKRVAEELINTGRATHPVIGVTLDMAYTGDGAKVGARGADGKPAVIEGGPGAKAGIRPGDVIKRVDGRRVHNGEELIIKIRAHRPGDRLDIVLSRGGKDLAMTLTLGSASGT
ncbi:trypsin-like peptidase domain-containing protein [Streptomyces sp. DT24]|uniref:S1C family serine protease n=1 Tax=Streptomyces sp. DT24 TaxID=3416520 RepID=UPI003CF4DECD